MVWKAFIHAGFGGFGALPPFPPDINPKQIRLLGVFFVVFLSIVLARHAIVVAGLVRAEA